jgi:phosphoribosylanthranilate isomerase
VTRIKFCGITSVEDARAAIRLGVDAVGLLVGLLYDSEDQLTGRQAADIVSELPPFVSATLVTHRVEPAQVCALARTVRPATLQLHGAFPDAAMPRLRAELPAIRLIKTVHVTDESAVAAAAEAAGHADAVLLDSRTATRIGGTGVPHDWSISRRIRDAIWPRPTILAGGLTPDNVAVAIARVQPYAVDVNSGVSLRRGAKSPELMARFIRAVRAGA